jgi:hypothetical protein
MPTRRDTLSLIPSGLLLAGASGAITPSTTDAFAAGNSPLTKATRIGTLHYEAGFPTADTVQKLYDEFDFQRAVLAYQSAERARQDRQRRQCRHRTRDGGFHLVDRLHGSIRAEDRMTLTYQTTRRGDNKHKIILGAVCGAGVGQCRGALVSTMSL